jgi:hypothetical protein
MSGCCASCLVPTDDDDPLLTAVGLCSRCEMACMAARARARQAASLTALLNEDSLVLALAFACMGRAAHRQGCRLAAINHAFRRVVTEQLWRAFCLAEHSGGVVERLLLSIPVPSITTVTGPALAPLGTDWAAAHRLLSVPLRFRTRSCRSWGRMLRLRHRGLDKPSVLRIDASAASQLSPGFGFTSWRGADDLLSPTGRGAIGGPKEVWLHAPFEPPGADAFRWLFYAANAPWTNTRLSLRAIREGQREFHIRLGNVYSFFSIYANIAGFDPALHAGRKTLMANDLRFVHKSRKDNQHFLV